MKNRRCHETDMIVSPCLSTIHQFRMETKDKNITVSIETGTTDLQFWVSFPFGKKNKVKVIKCFFFVKKQNTVCVYFTLKVQ